MAVRNKKRAPTRRKAATADVLGDHSPTKARVPTRWKSYYQRLVRLRDHLLHRQGGLVQDARQGQSAFGLHMADAATDSFDRDLALSRASSEQDALYEIDHALNRIRDGTYGKCELTGKRIEPARLVAIPWARFSVDAETQLERDGAVQRARLAPREPVIRDATQSGGGDEPMMGEPSDRD